jgi:FkbM family methyltransferase
MKTTILKLKRMVMAGIGQDLFVRPNVVYDNERFGSDYGGWNVVTKNMGTHSVVYSFGVGEDASFDLALIERFGLTVQAFDPTPKSIKWVKNQNFPEGFIMHDYGIAASDGDVLFNPPENPNHVSHTLLDRPSTASKAISVPVKRLGTIMEELGHTVLDIIKMDVEGAEYDVITDISESGIRPTQILVEFHHRFPGVGVKKSKEAINRLLSIGYGIFSVSSTCQEVCFIRARD